VAKSIWNYQVSSNPHVLAIYLKLVLSFGNWFERFDGCQCEDDGVGFFLQT
jgi:hypothetical protein